MLACLADGKTVISNPSLEPEIDDLINFLNSSGAKIKRTNEQIEIEGVDTLTSQKPYSIQNDRNEAVTYACLALATRGEVLIKGINPHDLKLFIASVKEIGGEVQITEKGIVFKYVGELRASNITVLPHPGFMTDWQGPWAVLMTQARGESTIHETIYENRFAYVKELRKLGAHIKFYQPQIDDPEKTYQFNWTENHNSPQAIKINGPTKLHNGVMTVADLRAGATLLIAAAVAKGESVLNGASIIERGYENIVEKITQLGGTIKKV
jgi:UDP-N-acetylglucosamine 1-carboxyvinyltransferase